MKKYMVFLATLMFLIPFNPVQAESEPIISPQGMVIGKVYLDTRNNHPVMDFDFDQPIACQLTRITVSGDKGVKTYVVAANKQHNENLDGVAGTYITPRDAVIPIEMNHFLSNLLFYCDGSQVTAGTKPIHIMKSGRYPGVVKPLITSHPTPAFVEGKSSGDGFFLHFNTMTNRWEYASSLSPVAPTPAVSPRPDPTPAFYEGKSSGDGLFLHFNTTKNQWEFVNG